LFYALGQSIEFKLQTCSNAEIVLAVTPYNQNTDGYKIKLGTRSSITRLHDPNKEISVDSGNLLNCYVLRTYWITWFNGIITVGYGRLNSTLLMELKDTNVLSIVAVTLSTPESINGGEWQVSRNSGW
jgi:hypothetical protein